MATHRTGGEVDAYCTRCKMTLAHTIVAMVGPKIVRVKCNTCRGDHAFRPEPGASSPRTSTPRAAARPAGAAPTREERVVISFDDELASKDTANARRYSPRETFAVDQVVEHPTFGYGYVKAVRGDKVDIVFKTDVKTLVHGRGGAPADKPAFQPPAARASGPADKLPAAAPDAEAGGESAEG